jgi:hypothetical protein
LAGIGLIGAIAWAHPKGRWRIDTIALKLRGEIPEYSLSDVLAAQLPTGWSEEKILPVTGSLVMGRVSLPISRRNVFSSP